MKISYTGIVKISEVPGRGNSEPADLVAPGALVEILDFEKNVLFEYRVPKINKDTRPKKMVQPLKQGE